jgi:hypothetical protein
MNICKTEISIILFGHIRKIMNWSCLPARIELGSHWADFHEICYLVIFERLEKIQIWLKSDKHNRCFMWRPRYI